MQDRDLQDAGTLRAEAHDGAGYGDGHAAGGLRAALPGNRGGSLWDGVARLAGFVPPAVGQEQNSGALSRGGQRAPGTWRADGGDVGPTCSVKDHAGPRFDATVNSGGYAWWYLDALSDDGHHGLTMIAFIGSVFSPYYALACRTPGAVATNHCAINVALTGRGGHRWAMTERDDKSLAQSARELTIGSSRMSWNGRSLVADIDELTAPIPRRLRGRITLHPAALTDTLVPLDLARQHTWSPIAPVARVEVELTEPALSWKGFAYLDSNFGSAPLATAFKHWSWSRTIEPNRTRVLYDVTDRRDADGSLALEFDHQGRGDPIAVPPVAHLPSTLWRVKRSTRADTPSDARVVETWEDGPFYARSLVETRLGGAPVMAVHESLSLDRFKMPIVQAMLPFRMPRRSHPPRG
jgi:carotenoid 1,2-hydratase